MKKKIIISLMSLIIIFFNACIAQALNTEFEVTSLAEEDYNNISKNLIFNKIESQTYNSISCFDIRSDGWITIGSEKLSDQYIEVFNEKGEFQYGFSFYVTSSFELEWDNENIIVYIARSDLAILIDRDGYIIDMTSIKQNSIKNNSYWNYIDSPIRQIGNTKYNIKNDMGILNFITSSFSQLVKKEANGDETILYNVNEGQFIQTIFIVLGGVFFIIYFSILMSRLIIKNNKLQKQKLRLISQESIL